MSHNQRALYDEVAFTCSKETTIAYSTSFSLGIRLLHARFRKAIYGIYGFVRYADEIVDTLHEFNKAELMTKFRKDTDEAIQNKVSSNPILHAFQITYHKYSIDYSSVDQFLNSMEMDLSNSSYDRAGYENYILGSAEVVGLMCLRVFTEGNDEMYKTLKPHAMSLGAAFQKINFLRDLKADFADLGRSYFPSIDMTQFNDDTKRRIELEIEEDFNHAYQGILQLPKDARLGVFIAYVYYRRLFSKIKSIPSHRIMSERVRVPNANKLALLATCYVRNNLNML